MFPRSACRRCSRSIAMNGDGQLRSHYCPHYTPCELGTCIDCAALRDRRQVGTDDSQPRAAAHENEGARTSLL